MGLAVVQLMIAPRLRANKRIEDPCRADQFSKLRGMGILARVSATGKMPVPQIRRKMIGPVPKNGDSVVHLRGGYNRDRHHASRTIMHKRFLLNSLLLCLCLGCGTGEYESRIGQHRGGSAPEALGPAEEIAGTRVSIRAPSA